MEERLTMANETLRPKFKRKQYLIHKKFQLKYVGLILALMILTAALCSYVVYYTSMISLGEKLANVYPQGRLVSIVKIVNFRIMLSVLLITPLVVLTGIFLSHKIAGPIYRMESFLKSMSAGDLTGRIVLRKGDELNNLAEGINSLNDELRSSFILQKAEMEKILLELNNIRNILDEKPIKASNAMTSLNRLDSELRLLIQEMNKYKVEAPDRL